MPWIFCPGKAWNSINTIGFTILPATTPLTQVDALQLCRTQLAALQVHDGYRDYEEQDCEAARRRT